MKSIGIDFDNTIVSYDDVIYKKALSLKLIDKNIKKNKKNIRDDIRRLLNGEIEWQKLQAFVYGEGMKQAKLIEGVKEFFQACHQAKIPVYIISHKTRYASMDKGVDLHLAAQEWMRQNGFFEAGGFGLSSAQVFFESTRGEKISRIERLRCTHVIDDLEETFLEANFPKKVQKILYAPHKEKSDLTGVRTFFSWKDIYAYFFSSR